VKGLASEDHATTELRLGGPEQPAWQARGLSPMHSTVRPVTSAGDEQERLEREEHFANVTRFRAAITAGCFILPAFGLLDLLVDLFIQPGVLAYFLAVRLAIWPVAIVIALRLRRQPMPGPRLLRGLALLAWCLASLMVGLMCAEYGGLESAYAPGFIVVTGIAGAANLEPWRRGIVHASIVTGVGPAVVLFSVALDPELRHQLSDARALAKFGQSMTFVVCLVGLTVLSSHTMWSLRRQVYQARSIGRYRLEKKLGMGGMGEVWAAYHSGLRRSVALKLLRGAEARPELVERFEREVAALGDLKHPNTVRVFDYGVSEDGIWYYAMELLEGEDLAALLRREERLPPERAIKLVWQAARALGEAHDRGIVHRDLKPENLFVTQVGNAGDFLKVLDFGIAKMTDGKQLTQTGMVAGTPAFMSPEAASGRPSDPRSDVYSLGVVLFDLVTGTLPFAGDRAVELMFAHMELPAPDPREREPTVPGDLCRVIGRCLEKRPADRFADGNALAAALERCAAFRP
jgi:hypothetical protein